MTNVLYIGKALADRVVIDGDCWRWTGCIGNHGYGAYGKPLRLAHRMSYEFFRGPIPDGLTIDHLCRNRWCIKPSHLEPVTRAENVLRGESPPARNARKTHCPHGHEYNEANTYINPNTGWRLCRACQADAYHKKKATA